MQPTTLEFFSMLTTVLCSWLLKPRVTMRISIVAQLIPGKGRPRIFEIGDPAVGIPKCCISGQLVDANGWRRFGERRASCRTCRNFGGQIDSIIRTKRRRKEDVGPRSNQN